MSGGKGEKGKKLVERYGQIYSQGCSGCSLGTGCGPNFEVVLNIKKKESTKKD